MLLSDAHSSSGSGGSGDGSRSRPQHRHPLLHVCFLAWLWSSLVLAASDWSSPEGERLLETSPSDYVAWKHSDRLHSEKDTLTSMDSKNSTLSNISNPSRDEQYSKHNTHNSTHTYNLLNHTSHIDIKPKHLTNTSIYKPVEKTKYHPHYQSLTLRHGYLPKTSVNTTGTLSTRSSLAEGWRSVLERQDPLGTPGPSKIGTVAAPLGFVTDSGARGTRTRRWPLTGEDNGRTQNGSTWPLHPGSSATVPLSLSPSVKSPDSKARELNPLRISTTSHAKPSALRYTPLAHPHHRNVSYAPRPPQRHTPPRLNTSSYTHAAASPRPLYDFSSTSRPHHIYTTSLPLNVHTTTVSHYTTSPPIHNTSTTPHRHYNTPLHTHNTNTTLYPHNITPYLHNTYTKATSHHTNTTSHHTSSPHAHNTTPHLNTHTKATPVNPEDLLLSNSPSRRPSSPMRPAKPDPSHNLAGHRVPEVHEGDAVSSGFLPYRGGGGGGGGGSGSSHQYPTPAPSHASIQASKTPVVPASLLVTLADHSYLQQQEQQRKQHQQKQQQKHQRTQQRPHQQQRHQQKQHQEKEQQQQREQKEQEQEKEREEEEKQPRQHPTSKPPVQYAPLPRPPAYHFPSLLPIPHPPGHFPARSPLPHATDAPHLSAANITCHSEGCLEENMRPELLDNMDKSTLYWPGPFPYPESSPLSSLPLPHIPSVSPTPGPPSVPSPLTPAAKDLLQILRQVFGPLPKTRVPPSASSSLTGQFDSQGAARPLIAQHLPLVSPQGHYPGENHMGHHNTPSGAASSPWDDYYTFQLNPIRRISPGGSTDAAHVLRLQGGTGQGVGHGVGHGGGYGAGYGVSPGVPAYPSPLALATLLNLKALSNPTGSPQPTPSRLYRQDRQQPEEEPEQALPQPEQREEPDSPQPEQQLQQELERRQTMRRMITAAGFVLPVTTALLGALGAPVALMAPLGLAIPALLSTRFLDISGRSTGLGSGWRLGPSYGGMQGQEGWEAEESPGGDREAVAALSHNVSGREVTGRRRRDVTEGTSGVSRDSRNTTETSQTPQQDEEASLKGLTRREQDNTSSLLLLLPEELEVLDSLTQYYQSLSILDHDGPTLEEITAHRLFLLSLLQKLTAGKTKENSLGRTPTTTTTTSNKNTTLPPLQPNTPVEGRADTTPFPTPSPRPNLQNKAINSSRAPEGVAEGDKASGVDGTREGSASSLQVPSSRTRTPLPALTPARVTPDDDLMIRKGDITALIPSHWPPPLSSTQHPPPLPQSPQLTQLIHSLAEGDFEAAAFLPQPQPAAPSSSPDFTSDGFYGGFPPSLLQPGLLNELHKPSPPSTSVYGFPPSLLQPDLSELHKPSPPSSTTVYGEPSPFSNYSALSDHLLHLYGFPPASPPAVIMVASDYEDLQQVADPTLLEEDAVQDVPAAVAAAALAVGDTTQLAQSIIDFITNIVSAFSELFSDLQQALTDNPALALLFFIPFLVLPFFSRGYGRHGGFHRRVYFMPQGRAYRDAFARQVLADIEHLKSLYGASSDDALLLRLPPSSLAPHVH